MKKAVSPLLASVLLIAFTVGIATLTSGFVSTTFRSAESTVTNKTAQASDCSSAEIVIDDVFTKTGDNGTVTMPVRNSGSADLQITSAQLYDKLGNNFSASGMPKTGFARGSIANLNFQMPKLPNTTTDYSALGNTGDCNNMGVNNVSNTCSFTLSGKSGSAMMFRLGETDDYVDISPVAGFNYSYGAITAWINPDSDSWNSPTSQQYVVELAEGTYYFILQKENWTEEPRYVDLRVYNGSVSGVTNASYITTWTTGWHHLAATWEENGTNDALKLYVDGELVSVNLAGRLPPEWTGWLRARIGNTMKFNGTIDEVTIWNRTLSGTEINSTMHSGATSINTTGLVGYWRFDEGKGVLVCSDFSKVLVSTNCGGISAEFDRMPRCS